MKYEQRLEAIISGGVDPSLTDVPDSTLIEWLGLLAIEVRMSRESIAKVRGRLQAMRKGLQARKGAWYMGLDNDDVEQRRVERER